MSYDNASGYKGYDAELVKVNEGDGETVIAGVSSFSLDDEPNIDPIYEHGSRTVQEWKKGNKEVSGSLDKVYWDNTYLDQVNADSAPTIMLRGKVNTAAGTKTVECSGVIFDSWSWDVPAEDFVEESIDFRAKDLTTS